MRDDSSEREPHGRRVTTVKGLAFLLIMAGFLAAGAFFALGQRSGGGAIVATEAPAPIPVRVVRAELQETLSLAERYAGIAETRRASSLGFERGGRITAINADVGDEVKRGDVLAKLDTRALEAQLASARAQVSEAEAARTLAISTVERLRPLYAENLTPKQRLDEAEAALTQAEARIRAMEASAELIEVQIGLSRITAPFDGVITARMADEGTIASPSAPILRIAETGEVEFRFGLPATIAEDFSEDRTYTLTRENGEYVDVRLKARTGVVDAAGRTVEVVFANAGEVRVRSGEVVSLEFSSELNERGLWLPVTALNEASRGLWSVYVAEADQGGYRATPRLVEIVQAEEARAFVRGPISGGDRVILSGIQRLSPGMPVTPTEADPDSVADLDAR